MKKIKVKILNPESIDQAEKLMVCAARLTQRGHQISCLDDFMDLYEKPYQRSTVANLVKLPHPTIQKFGIINVVVVGASRRFLAQITRHQNEVKYMSASLQYSDYSGVEDFVIPYDLIGTGQEEGYLRQCSMAMKNYQEMIRYGVDNDSAGYCAPQGMRNILLIGATPYQWKHMIRQRTCRRNTKETRYVMLKIWEQLLEQTRELFSDCGAFCMNGGCEKGKMTCGKSIPPRCYQQILSGWIFQNYAKRVCWRKEYQMKIQLIDFGGRSPERAHANDAGADVFSPKDVEIRPGDICKLPLGFGLKIPDGYAGYIFPRSGLSSQGIVCELPPIDSGYTGEVHAIISNVGNREYEIKSGDKVGQLVIMPVLIPDFIFENWKKRGIGSFGSTGR